MNKWISDFSLSAFSEAGIFIAIWRIVYSASAQKAQALTIFGSNSCEISGRSSRNSHTAHDYNFHMQLWIFDARNSFHDRVEILSNHFPHCFMFCVISNFAEIDRRKRSWEEGSCIAYKPIQTKISQITQVMHPFTLFSGKLIDIQQSNQSNRISSSKSWGF